MFWAIFGLGWIVTEFFHIITIFHTNSPSDPPIIGQCIQKTLKWVLVYSTFMFSINFLTPRMLISIVIPRSRAAGYSYPISKNQDNKILVILDNFSSHRVNVTVEFAREKGIELIFLPPYSPDLNPIEFIWKSIKRIISKEFIVDLDHMRSIIRDNFQIYSSQISFAERRIEKFPIL